MDDFSLVFLWDDDLQLILLGQSRLVEVFFHRELRAEQADAANFGGFDSLGSRVGNVQHWKAARHLNSIYKLVHRVGADQDRINLSVLQYRCCGCYELACFIPLAAVLKFDDIVQIEGVDDAPRRMHPT